MQSIEPQQLRDVGIIPAKNAIGADGRARIDRLPAYSDAAHTTLWSAAGTGLVSGTGAGAVQSIPVHGRVAPQSAAPGQYSDTEVVTITYQ